MCCLGEGELFLEFEHEVGGCVSEFSAAEKFDGDGYSGAASAFLSNVLCSVVFGEFGEATVDGFFGFADEFGYLGFG